MLWLITDQHRPGLIWLASIPKICEYIFSCVHADSGGHVLSSLPVPFPTRIFPAKILSTSRRNANTMLTQFQYPILSFCPAGFSHCYLLLLFLHQVEDVNDNAPLTSDPIYHPIIKENSPKDVSVIRIQAQDPDLTATPTRLSYRISAGNPQNFFSINPKTGKVHILHWWSRFAL